jgi:demethylmenaquinone methyltransferase / 2-methoxy-6-polyprenyl-1,4-benzoquinol methylase
LAGALVRMYLVNVTEFDFDPSTVQADLPVPAALRDHARYDTGRMTLRAALSSADSKAPYVRRLFHTIADRYDLITGLLSFGRDRRWKARLVALAEVRAGARALDLAAGTGDIAFALAAGGARVAALDITHRMLQIASRKRPAGAAVAFVTGDMMSLPFHDGTFDLVTTGYGIRNVPAIEPALAEIRRVLRPGGVLLSLDFDRPANPLVRAAYLGYLTVVGSALGWVLHRDADTYRYIPESIRRYPGAAGVAVMLARAGFADSRVIPLLGGLMAINTARRLR